MKKMISRRTFLKNTGAVIAGSTLPLNLVKLSFADNSALDFTFAYISDAHITYLKKSDYVRNWDRGLIRAVAETNLLYPKPDFIVFGGDIAQLGKPEEIDHGLELLSKLRSKVYYVMGEHDYYLDLGEHWEKRLGPQYHSFDHKGVHFVVLNSILTYQDWTHKWSGPMARMLAMARLDNPGGSPFMVGEKQRQWLKNDLAKIDSKTPVVVFSHSPIQKIFKGWNFWTEDAQEVQSLLKRFNNATVVYGHVHQIQYNQIGNISFCAVMATAWPWPYPESYAQAPNALPKLTVRMNRADPFFERDATGWQFINVNTGKVDMHFKLSDNTDRTVAFDPKSGRPQDTVYQDETGRVPPQLHY